MFTKSLLLTLCLGLLSLSPTWAQSSSKGNKWILLFNGKNLKGWETYLDSPYTADKSVKTAPIGLNNDPNQVFSVVTTDGKPALRISGETFGGINTLADFENYHADRALELRRERGGDVPAPCEEGSASDDTEEAAMPERADAGPADRGPSPVASS